MNEGVREGEEEARNDLEPKEYCSSIKRNVKRRREKKQSKSSLGYFLVFLSLKKYDKNKKKDLKIFSLGFFLGDFEIHTGQFDLTHMCVRNIGKSIE